MIRRLGFLIVVCACTDHVQLARDPLNGLVSLSIKPDDASLVIGDLSQPPLEQDFKAIGTFLDGTKHDVTGLVRWHVDNVYPGDFTDPGVYLTSNAASGHVLVQADGDNVSATATLTILVNATIVDTTFPPPAPDVFQPGLVITGDPTHSPNVIYPSDGTRMPQGVASTLFQLTPGDSNDTFLWSFDCELFHLAILTGADRWQAEDQTQLLLSQSCLGQDIAVNLEAASSITGTIYGAPQVSLAFSVDRPDGVLYYWSAATSGIVRGELGATSAPKLYPNDATCVGCHTAQRDGSALAMDYGNDVLQTITLPQLTTTIDAQKRLPMGWASFSPDGKRVVVANKGALTLYDAATGLPVGPGAGKVPLPAMRYATHPDWSPDGKSVAIALTATAPADNMGVDAASIAVLPFTNDTWGTPQMLVSSVGPADNNYFPKYSPDGAYLAFVHASGNSHGAASADLELVRSIGGTPVALTTASTAGVGDTMPSWAPLQGERAWLAFASSRAYGLVLPADGRPQIWIVAVDLAHATTTGDPSSAAFWLPAQDVTVLNNNPIWSSPATP
jgi:hypothetical protein